jgi:2Fe-2S ferredoxin
MQEIQVDNMEKPLIFFFACASLDWMQACGQKGRCTTCAFEVLEGMENLSEASEAEMRYLAAGRLLPGQRLACQARTSGNLLIGVPRNNQLPHMQYNEE